MVERIFNMIWLNFLLEGFTAEVDRIFNMILPNFLLEGCAADAVTVVEVAAIEGDFFGINVLWNSFYCAFPWHHHLVAVSGFFLVASQP